MPKVKILYAINTRDSDYIERDEVLKWLCSGGYFEAGEIEVAADVSYDNEEGRADWSNALEEAWKMTHGNFNPDWNNRSARIGDLFVVDGGIHRVVGVGFKYIVAYGILDRHRGIVLGEDPYKDYHRKSPVRRINTEFDELITDA